MHIHTISPKLDDYIDKNCSNINKNDVKNWLERYNVLLDLFKNGTEDSIPEHQKKDYFNSFVWGTMATAIEKNQGFVQGTIVFKDTDHRIVKFFSSIAYRRTSSHFKTRKKAYGNCLSRFFSDFGIDDNRFPAKHTTALFSPLTTLKKEEDYSFLKIEEHSFNLTKPLSTIKHGWRYIATRPRVWNLPFFKCDVQYREEDTPHEYISTFKNILKETPLDPNSYTSTLKTIHHYGIAGIWRESQKLLHKAESDVAESWQYVVEKILELQSHLKSRYSDLEVRKGNEVVLDANDFCRRFTAPAYYRNELGKINSYGMIGTRPN